ncbi:MAG: hypothetical protein MJ236_04715 [Clostridia bacterium]|nr:hypothetical protein [Clostridia bacterium]
MKLDSIITRKMGECYVCANTQVQYHHIIPGHAYRHKSDEYHIIVPLCLKHHNEAHQGKELDLTLRAVAQIKFEKKYSHEKWMEEFKIDYKERYEREFRK